MRYIMHNYMCMCAWVSLNLVSFIVCGFFIRIFPFIFFSQRLYFDSIIPIISKRCVSGFLVNPSTLYVIYKKRYLFIRCNIRMKISIMSYNHSHSTNYPFVLLAVLFLYPLMWQTEELCSFYGSNAKFNATHIFFFVIKVERLIKHW